MGYPYPNFCLCAFWGALKNDWSRRGFLNPGYWHGKLLHPPSPKHPNGLKLHTPRPGPKALNPDSTRNSNSAPRESSSRKCIFGSKPYHQAKAKNQGSLSILIMIILTFCCLCYCYHYYCYYFYYYCLATTTTTTTTATTATTTAITTTAAAVSTTTTTTTGAAAGI